MSDKNRLTNLLDQLKDLSENQDNVSVGDVVNVFNHRSYAPFLIIPPLFEMSPIGGIPGVPTFLAVIIVLFAIQIAFGRHKMWLPDFLGHRKISGQKLKKAVKVMKPWAQKIDGWLHEKLSFLTGQTAVRAAAICALILCLLVPPLELVPFGSTVPMSAIALFGLSILFRNGYLMLFGYGFVAATLYLLWQYFL
jgi:hypothetical protein